jgi:hypothetical protein
MSMLSDICRLKSSVSSQQKVFSAIVKSGHRNIIELGHSISSYLLVLVLKAANNKLSALRQAGPRDSNV